MVEIAFQCKGAGSIPGWGAEIPRDSWPKNQNIKNNKKKPRNNIVINFNTDFKNGPREKKKILKLKKKLKREVRQTR